MASGAGSWAHVFGDIPHRSGIALMAQALQCRSRGYGYHQGIPTMKATPRITLTTLSLTAAIALTTACGGDNTAPPEGEPQLSIIGDRNLLLDYNKSRDLVVRYHDTNDEALEGDIGFNVAAGSTEDSVLSGSSAKTDNDGYAEVTLKTGKKDASFQVAASAALVDDVKFVITVSKGAKPLPIDVAGTYNINSRFDMADNLPGTLGEIATEFFDFSDSPGKYLAEKMDLSGFARDFVGSIIDEWIRQEAPGLVPDLIEMGDRIGDAVETFGTISELKVKSGGAATHTLTAYQFEVDNKLKVMTLRELGSDNVVIKDVKVTLDGSNKLTIAAHDVGLRYGGALRKIIEDEIIPLVSSGSKTLADLIKVYIDCGAIGARYAAPPLFSATFIANTCTASIDIGAIALLVQLDRIDEEAPVVLKITGTATAKDTDSDRKVDTIEKGMWTGQVDYAGAVVDLAKESGQFTATREK